MRAIVVLFAALSLSAGLGLAEDLEVLKAGVVKLRAKTEGQSARTGTGFIISLTKDQAIILTATHVIEGDSAPTVEFYGNQMAPASAKVGKQHSGLALLTVPRDRLPEGAGALALSAEKLAETTEVKVIGFPMGGAPWSVVRASISAPDGLDLTLDGTIREGNSGGPVLHGAAVVAMVTQTTDFARAIPASIILQLLTNWRISFTLAGKQEPTDPPSSAAVPKPEPCLQGYVWREAFPGDYVCVEPPVRSQAAYDNSQANHRRQPGGGAYGPDTCIQGFVWREASPEDRVCVKPETRDQARKDNQQASKRVQRAKSTIKDLRIRRESIIKPR